MQTIADVLATHPRARAIVAVHGDARKLSKQRAEAVVLALTRLGVDASRLRARALASKPSAVTNKGCGLPPGALQIIDQFGNAATWTVREASGVLWISKD
ncbi:hypothetical protein [Methylosinus sp. Sm6]|uniref:hypothetical protein n=1 Tax=Methylosinus sp. Sm6 TaxID=2866948 RepID=UPI001C9A0A5B|nr:hypothetical protein [Methylosinus sp. Sm6]MBY6240080.1 hypothetical protein [Methylosinus sp. Sm6]